VILVPPSASRMFIILAGVEAGLSRSSTSRAGSWVTLSCGVRGRRRSPALRAGWTSTTRGRSTAGVVCPSASGSSAWPLVPPPAGRRLPRRVHGGPPKMSRAARAAFVFWGGPAFAPVRCLRGEVGALLVREDPSGDLPAGRWPLSSVPRRRRLEKSPSPTGSPPPSALRASGSLYLSSPLERRRGRGQGCSSVRPEAIATAVWPPVEGVVVAAAGAGDGEPSVGLLLLRSPPIEWGCSYLRRWNQSSVCNGTSNASVFVHCGCRGLNMYVILARSRVFSSFSSTKTRLLVV
jgi:hypothetical protein